MVGQGFVVKKNIHLHKIEISVYGMRPQPYGSEARAPGAFVEFRRGLQLLQERRVPFVVISVLLPLNRDEIAEFEVWATTIPSMDVEPSYAVFLDLQTRRDSPSKNRLITRLRFSPEAGVALVARHSYAYNKGMAQFATKFMGLQNDKLFPCGAGETGRVDAYGKGQMCMLLRHPGHTG
jgi:hypothetical protein